VAHEVELGQPVVLAERPLMKAQAKDYVRQAQERLIGEPILQRVRSRLGRGGTEQRLLALLDHWRGQSVSHSGYGPGNAVNLLRLLRGDLCATDLSRLDIRQAYLAQVDAQDASLTDSHLADCRLADAFEFPGYIALSADAEYLLAGTTTGEVWLWRVADRTPLWTVQGHIGTVYGVALSADGYVAVSGAADGTVRTWDARTGHAGVTLNGHTGTVRDVAISADGRGEGGTPDGPDGQPVSREEYLSWERKTNDAVAGRAGDGVLNEFITSGDRLADTLARVAPADLELPAWHQSGVYTVGTLMYWRIYELGFHGWDVRATLDSAAVIRPELCPYVLGTLRQLQPFFSTPAATIQATCRFEVDGQSWITRIHEGKLTEVSDSSEVDAVIRTDACTYLLVTTLRQALKDSADRITIEGSRERAQQVLTAGGVRI
jgi:hypothetical protein